MCIYIYIYILFLLRTIEHGIWDASAAAAAALPRPAVQLFCAAAVLHMLPAACCWPTVTQRVPSTAPEVSMYVHRELSGVPVLHSSPEGWISAVSVSQDELSDIESRVVPQGVVGVVDGVY